MTSVDIDGLFNAYDERVKKGDTSSVTTNVEEHKEEIKKKTKQETKQTSTNNFKYTGPIKILLDEHPEDFYSPHVLVLKHFFDELAQKGVTYEHFFEKIEEYVKETGDKTITVNKMKNKIYKINNSNVLTIETINKICKILGYELVLSFRPMIDPKMFE